MDLKKEMMQLLTRMHVVTKIWEGARDTYQKNKQEFDQEMATVLEHKRYYAERLEELEAKFHLLTSEHAENPEFPLPLRNEVYLEVHDQPALMSLLIDRGMSSAFRLDETKIHELIEFLVKLKRIENLVLDYDSITKAMKSHQLKIDPAIAELQIQRVARVPRKTLVDFVDTEMIPEIAAEEHKMFEEMNDKSDDGDL